VTVLHDGAIVTGGQVRQVAGGGTLQTEVDFGLGRREGCTFLVVHDADGRLLDHQDEPYGLSTCVAGMTAAASGEQGGLALVGVLAGAEPGGPRFAGKNDALIVMLDTK